MRVALDVHGLRDVGASKPRRPVVCSGVGTRPLLSSLVLTW